MEYLVQLVSFLVLSLPKHKDLIVDSILLKEMKNGTPLF